MCAQCTSSVEISDVTVSAVIKEDDPEWSYDDDGNEKVPLTRACVHVCVSVLVLCDL